MVTFLVGVYQESKYRTNYTDRNPKNMGKQFAKPYFREFELLFEGIQNYINSLHRVLRNKETPQLVRSKSLVDKLEEEEPKTEDKPKMKSGKVLSLCKKIEGHCKELHHILSKNELSIAGRNIAGDIPKHSKLQRLNIECKIIEDFIDGKQALNASRYFLEFDNIILNDWSWLQEISTKSMKTKFQTETIHKLSSSMLEFTNPIIASLIYQITNLKDPKVKENLQKCFNTYYVNQNLSLLGDESLQNSLYDSLKDDLNGAMKYIWRIDFLSLLVV